MSKKKKNKGKAGSKGGVKSIFTRELDTKGSVKNTAIETGISLAMGALGAAAGWAIGRPSLLIGIGTSILGHYTDQPRLKSLAIGLIASGGSEALTKGFSGASVNGLEGAKDRILAFGENLKHRLYLDKIIKSKEAPATDGIGDVQYFKYPNNNNELDMGSLNDIEDQISGSADQYERESQTNGLYDEDQMYGAEAEPNY